MNLAQVGEIVILEPDPVKIRMRPHGGRYEDEMAAAMYIEEAADVLSYVHCFYSNRRPAMKDIAQRYFGLDARNGWHSWLITLRASPILWTDKEVPGIRLLEPVTETSGPCPPQRSQTHSLHRHQQKTAETGGTSSQSPDQPEVAGEPTGSRIE